MIRDSESLVGYLYESFVSESLKSECGFEQLCEYSTIGKRLLEKIIRHNVEMGRIYISNRPTPKSPMSRCEFRISHHGVDWYEDRIIRK